MECVNTVLPIILYILGAVLLITLIIFVIKCMGTLKKINAVVDDVSHKAGKLDGIFSLIDNTTDVISNVGDKVVDFIAGAVTGLFSRKKKKKVEDEENEENERY